MIELTGATYDVLRISLRALSEMQVKCLLYPFCASLGDPARQLVAAVGVRVAEVFPMCQNDSFPKA